MALAVVLAAPAAGQEIVTEVDWATTAPLSGFVEDGAMVVDAGPGVYPVTVIADPALGGGDIMMAVGVVWEDLAEPGYMELWAVYDDGGRFFSRTLDAEGSGVLRSSGTGTVQLPFSLEGTVPNSLELNAVLPGGGHIEIGAVTLYEFGGTATLVDDSDAWWSNTTGGVVGGIAGSLVGLVGALVGVLASRLRARSFVLGTLKVGAAAGVALLAVGLFALVVGQPYEVWFVLLLGGVILAAVFGGLVPQVTVRYEAAELQRMRAHDLV
jgi:hypothetical protein